MVRDCTAGLFFYYEAYRRAVWSNFDGIGASLRLDQNLGGRSRGRYSLCQTITLFSTFSVVCSS